MGGRELDGCVKEGESKIKKGKVLTNEAKQVLAQDYVFYTMATWSTAGNGHLISRFILIISSTM